MRAERVTPSIADADPMPAELTVQRSVKVRYSPERLCDLAMFVKKATPRATVWHGDKIAEFIDMPVKREIVCMPCGGYREVEKVKQMAERYMLEHGIPAEVMQTRSRDLVLVQCRREVWKFLRDAGVSFPLIENATGSAHGTIIEGLKRHISTYDLIHRLPAEKLAECLA